MTKILVVVVDDDGGVSYTGDVDDEQVETYANGFRVAANGAVVSVFKAMPKHSGPLTMLCPNPRLYPNGG